MATFSDAQLIQIVVKAGRRINRRLCLTGTSNEITIDATTGEVTAPDNNDLDDLVLMQAECMIAGREFSEELSNGTTGVLVKDGEQILDTRASAIARGTFYNSPHSPCEELKEAIAMRKMLMSGNSGKLVY